MAIREMVLARRLELGCLSLVRVGFHMGEMMVASSSVPKKK
jgi:hypothetical protein